jgi:hypothetical protein
MWISGPSNGREQPVQTSDSRSNRMNRFILSRFLAPFLSFLSPLVLLTLRREEFSSRRSVMNKVQTSRRSVRSTTTGKFPGTEEFPLRRSQSGRAKARSATPLSAQRVPILVPVTFLAPKVPGVEAKWAAVIAHFPSTPCFTTLPRLDSIR